MHTGTNPVRALSADAPNFYQYLQESHSKPQALRQAMLSTMKAYPAPHEWAAFMLVGQ